MQTQFFSKLAPEQQEKLTSNVVEAVQVLYASVKARKEKEFIEKMNNKEFNKYGRYTRTTVI